MTDGFAVEPAKMTSSYLVGVVEAQQEITNMQVVPTPDKALQEPSPTSVPDADLAALFASMMSLAQEMAGLIDDASPEDRDEMFTAMSEVLAAASAVNSAILQPTSQKVDTVRRSAGRIKKAQNFVNDARDGDEKKLAVLDFNKVEEQRELAIKQEQENLHPTVDAVSTHPMSEYYAPECEATIRHLNTPAMDAHIEKIAALPDASLRLRATDLLVVDTAFHALSEAHQKLCCSALDMKPDEINAEILSQQLKAIEARDGFNITHITEAFHHVKDKPPALSNDAPALSPHTLLAFEALHLAVDKGMHYVQNHQMMQGKLPLPTPQTHIKQGAELHGTIQAVEQHIAHAPSGAK
ncbi:MAG: hypothetical protein EAY65_04455 [Alphaproteobacteria bacterium]|nr:MAG: hypothetical protein EAY65_04455 [Alphaproteobacteria bacterium]